MAGPVDKWVLWVVPCSPFALAIVGAVHLCPHGSVGGPDEPEQDVDEEATRQKEIGRDEADGLELHVSCHGTGRAVPRPDMGHAVSVARKAIAAASEPFRHSWDHGGVADH